MWPNLSLDTSPLLTPMQLLASGVGNNLVYILHTCAWGQDYGFKFDLIVWARRAHT